MVKCIYCSNTYNLTDITEEHVIPRFLINEMGGANSVGYNTKSQKIEKRHGKIKSVCRSCNNEILSELDKYGKENYIKNCVSYDIDRNDANLNINFNLLSRWLLKINYNREHFSFDSVWLDEYLPYIMGVNSSYNNDYLRFYVELLSPCGASDYDVLSSSIYVEEGKLYPQIVDLNSHEREGFCRVYNLCLNSVIYRTICVSKLVDVGFAQNIHKYYSHNIYPEMIYLEPSTKISSIIAMKRSSRTIIDFYREKGQELLDRQITAINKYFDKKSNINN